MAQITALFGIALSLFGLKRYTQAPAPRHWTALFPLSLGLPMVLLGGLGLDERRARASAGAALGVAIVGLLVSLQALFFPQLFRSTAANGKEHPQRRAAQAGTAALCATYAGLAIGSLAQPR